MPTINDIFPVNTSGRGVVGNLNERASYGSKRRQMDLDLIFDVWNNLPKDVLDSKINLANVPKKAQKKYKRASAVHKDRLQKKDGEWMKKSAPFYHDQLEHAKDMIKDIQKVLPQYNSKEISDLPLDLRSRFGNWCDEANSITELLFWQYYRVANVLKLNGKPVSSLRYANEGLALVPPLQKGELPHKGEVLARLHRLFALEQMNEVELADSECRAILAAIRLLHYEKKLDMYDSKDILMKKTWVLPDSCIRRLVKLKMDEEGASRPYFTRDEHLSLMKELGIGLYSNGRFKCNMCGKIKVKGGPSLCSRCADVWYCSVECSRKGWRNGHKQECGSLLVQQPVKLSKRASNHVYIELVPSFSIIHNDGYEHLLVLARDKTNENELFDVLTDKAIQIEWNDEEGADISDDTWIRGMSGLGLGDTDGKSGLSAKELHDMRAATGDWLHGLAKIPYNKKWPDDF